MDPTLINGIVYFTVNFLLFFAGIFLNIVVVLSIWKSNQLRKKLCYFTIFLLSCSDLATVIIIHPLVIFWYITWYMEGNAPHSPKYLWAHIIGSTTVGSSLLGLLTMTLERYLGLAYPLFHKMSVTKKRLATFLFTIQAFPLISGTMNIIFGIYSFDQPYTLAFICALLIFVAILNCKMFSVAKSRKKATSSNGGKRIMGYKKHYPCILAVVLFFISSSPVTIYYGLVFSHLLNPATFANCLLFWARTAVTMTSTINSLIFFWLNKVLRSEGYKLLKGHVDIFRS